MFNIHWINVLTVVFVHLDTAGAWEMQGEWKCLKLQPCITEQLFPHPIPSCY